MKMDSIFNLEETERSSLLQQIIQSFGFTYVCLWSHFPHPSNCLIFIGGVYKEENQASSSSSGGLPMKSFQDYQKSIFLIDHNYSGGVPGFAFMNNLTYMDRKGLELLGSVSNSEQLHFYQEARIKTAIFMGCKNGEIELGMSNGFSQNINFESELKKLFPGDFPQELPSQQLDQARASSSSSSLRSLSMDNSAEYPPFLYNMLQTTPNMPGVLSFKEAFLDQQAPNHQTPPPSTMRLEDPLQHAIYQIRTNQLIPSREHEEAAMTKAILAAISSSSTSPSPSSSSSRKLAPRVLATAFKRYRSNLGPIKQIRVQNRQNLNRRSLSFFRNLHEAQSQQEYRGVQTTRPTSNQLHHMIAERKRREKLNDSFQALRSLLPPGSKKDKASVLSNTKEYLASLKSQVEELNKRNKVLEAKISGKDITIHDQDSGGFSGERLTVRIVDVVGESTSESRLVELEVNARGNSILTDLVGRILKFIKQIENLSLMSIDAQTRVIETESIANRVVLRLRIQGNEWDRSSFQEAVTRLLDDLAQ